MWVINLCAKVFCSIQTVPSILKVMGPSCLSRVCVHVPYSFPALCFFSLSSCLSSLFPFRAPLFYLSHIFSFSHFAVVCGLSIKRQSIETIGNKDAWKHHCWQWSWLCPAIPCSDFHSFPSQLGREAGAWESASKKNVSVAAKREGVTSFHNPEENCFLTSQDVLSQDMLCEDWVFDTPQGVQHLCDLLFCSFPPSRYTVVSCAEESGHSKSYSFFPWSILGKFLRGASVTPGWLENVLGCLLLALFTLK